MENLLISACLLGIPCRYDGRSVKAVDISALREKYNLIPVCPECMGGLSTPRPPAELQADGRVVNREGKDVTSNYRAGAEATLEIARREGCTLALLKEKSPSCGSGIIHNGKFDGGLVPGFGKTAALLLENGFEVFGESQIEDLLK